MQRVSPDRTYLLVIHPSPVSYAWQADRGCHGERLRPAHMEVNSTTYGSCITLILTQTSGAFGACIYTVLDHRV